MFALFIYDCFTKHVSEEVQLSPSEQGPVVFIEIQEPIPLHLISILGRKKKKT